MPSAQEQFTAVAAGVSTPSNKHGMIQNILLEDLARSFVQQTALEKCWPLK